MMFPVKQIGYGATETSPVISQVRLNSPHEKAISTVGTSIGHVEVGGHFSIPVDLSLRQKKWSIIQVLELILILFDIPAIWLQALVCNHPNMNYKCQTK